MAPVRSASRLPDAVRTPLRTLRNTLDAGLARTEGIRFRGNLGPRPRVSLLSIYRQKNARHLRSVLDASPDAVPFLWALDAPAPELAGHTIGTGPGMRFALLNRLLASAGEGWIVVMDDDCRFVNRDLRTLVWLAGQAGFDLCQPAHTRRSHVSWPLTFKRRFLVARVTRFVEIGPLFVVSPEGRSRVLPFPEDLRMGYGAEARWAANPALRMGIVDAVTIRHLSPVAGQYDKSDELRQAQEELDANGHASFESLQKTRARWPLWQKRPTW